jgi:hypothetical protein
MWEEMRFSCGDNFFGSDPENLMNGRTPRPPQQEADHAR